uniref:Uncharacterized protein n=1 Tax=Tetraselmis sp. GSL018 TaxID=582737 RepID=A0A061QNE2_9CHLO
MTEVTPYGPDKATRKIRPVTSRCAQFFGFAT